jgi:site-specific recombinase XerD
MTVETPTNVDPTIAELAADFELSLRAQGRSPATIRTYMAAVNQLAAFLAERSMPASVAGIAREHVEAFMADLFERRSRSTARTRFTGLHVFFSWLLDEGEIARSPMERMRTPEAPSQPVAVLDDDQIRTLLAECSGRSFADVRDNAVIRLFIDSGMRVGEMAGVRVEDLDFEGGVAIVTGKGGRRRAAPFGPKTAVALRRYLRARARHTHAGAPELWIGLFGPWAGPPAIRQMIERRGRDAGIEGLHPHMFRHGFAHRWLAAGGTEGDVMKLAGWTTRAMIDRYGSSVAAQRAREAHRRIAPGDAF